MATAAEIDAVFGVLCRAYAYTAARQDEEEMAETLAVYEACLTDIDTPTLEKKRRCGASKTAAGFQRSRNCGRRPDASIRVSCTVPMLHGLRRTTPTIRRHWPSQSKSCLSGANLMLESRPVRRYCRKCRSSCRHPMSEGALVPAPAQPTVRPITSGNGQQRKGVTSQ